MKRQCKKCGEEFPATPEFFVALKKKEWRGLATECRAKPNGANCATPAWADQRKIPARENQAKGNRAP
jgi:hypothetical protein